MGLLPKTLNPKPQVSGKDNFELDTCRPPAAHGWFGRFKKKQKKNKAAPQAAGASALACSFVRVSRDGTPPLSPQAAGCAWLVWELNRRHPLRAAGASALADTLTLLRPTGLLVLRTASLSAPLALAARTDG